MRQEASATAMDDTTRIGTAQSKIGSGVLRSTWQAI